MPSAEISELASSDPGGIDLEATCGRCGASAQVRASRQDAEATELHFDVPGPPCAHWRAVQEEIIQFVAQRLPDGLELMDAISALEVWVDERVLALDEAPGLASADVAALRGAWQREWKRWLAERPRVVDRP